MVWPVKHTARHYLGIYEFNSSVVNKSLFIVFKPAEVLKRSDQTKKEEVDVTVVDGTQGFH